jgi:primary-amine oxidase
MLPGVGPDLYSIDWFVLTVDAVDFTFYLSLTRDKGLRLYDVHYKGKRVLYEVNIRMSTFRFLANLVLQFRLDEAIAHYA